MKITCAAVLLGLFACGDKKHDRCALAIGHIFDLTLQGPLDAKPSKEEADVIETVREVTLGRCRSEGLSQAQADCILAAHYPDWDDQLRACAAFAANPPSWVSLRPPRAERQGLEGKPAIPDGPRESKLHFKQLVALTRSMCGLTDAGAVQCWGEPLRAPMPAGTFVQIATSNGMTCGREAAGTLKCTVGDPQLSDHTPTVPFSDFAVDDDSGCGVRTSDKQIECWNNLDFSDPLASPLAQFTTVVVNHTGACGRTVAGGTACFGESPPVLPPPDVLAWTSDEGTCAISKNHELTCAGTSRLGPTPTGRFDTVAMRRGHACATRTGGGTICWGENDAGECNVPQ